MPMITSYKDAEDLFSTARKQDKGKPIQNYTRLFYRGSAYVIEVLGVPICQIHLNNHVVFTAPINNIYDLTYMFYDVFGIDMPRRSNRAFIGSKSITDGYSDYFQGVTFLLPQKTCVNPRLPLANFVDKDKRKEWLAALREFKRGIKVRAKLGVFDTMIKQIAPFNSQVELEAAEFRDEHMEFLVTCMKRRNFDDGLMRLLVANTILSYPRISHSSYSGKVVEHHVLGFIGKYSLELRRRFGVFDEEKWKNQQ